MKFIQARNYTVGGAWRSVSLVVLHSMEHPEKPTAAEDVAAWFASDKAPQASAHFCVDSDSAVQCVRLDDIAWAAPGANRNGVHVEHAGWANQTDEDWRDAYSMPMLKISARVVAQLCRRYSLPVLFCPALGILRGDRGITTHAAVSAAYKTPGGHTDPGPAFPMTLYLELVAEALALPEPLGPWAPIV